MKRQARETMIFISTIFSGVAETEMSLECSDAMSAIASSADQFYDIMLMKWLARDAPQPIATFYYYQPPKRVRHQRQ